MKKTWITQKDEHDLSARLHGTNWNDFFVGDRGDKFEVDIPDEYKGRAGNDVMYGLDDQDWLWGGSGIDAIYGGNGDDRLFGGPGNDTLSGGKHQDTITGGSGADVFHFNAWNEDSGGSGLDVITDFDPRERGELVYMAIAQGFEIGTFAELKATMVQDGDDVVMGFSGFATLVLEDVRIGQLRADDFHLVVA